MSKSFHMPMDEFRRHGYAVIDWIADYYETIEQYPVLSQVEPGEIMTQLPEHPPEQGEAFEAMLKDVNEIVMPGITHWQSPNFFAFFPANVTPPAILGDLISAGLGVQGMLWATSPACTEIETRVMDWVAEMLDLPEKFRSTGAGGGVIQDSASSATLCALLAARERASGYQVRQKGGTGKYIAYVSTEGHSSIKKGAIIAGIGAENVRLVDVDEQFAIRPELFEAQVLADKAAGLIPFFVSASTGSTSSGAFDPLEEIGRICQAHNIWFHVDAAMFGTAAICPEFRSFHKGIELADSYTFNPHKWMFTNFDCNCFFVADRAELIKTLSILPEYLRNAATESGSVIDYRDWQVPLGRRFRALKLWFVIRHYGVEGLRHHIREHVAWAQAFKGWVEASELFDVAVPAELNLICFRYRGSDEENEALLSRLNGSGRVYLTHTKLNEQYTLRFCVGATLTEWRHIEEAWKLILQSCEKSSLT